MPKHLSYLSLPLNNGGVVVDVSEGGLGFRAIAPVEADGPIHFRFAIDSETRIKAVGELAWKDKTGKIGGLRFTELSEEVRKQIRTWATSTNVTATDVEIAGAIVAADANVIEDFPAEPAIAAEAQPFSDANHPPDEAVGHPLLYNLTPPIYSAPFNSFSMFPLELNSEAATAAAFPQFIQLIDEIREQVRDWAGQAKAGIYDNPFADPAFETEIVRQGEADMATFAEIAIAEPPIESEYFPGGKADLEPTMDALVAEPAIESEAPPDCESDLDRIVAAGNPLLYNLKPPVYRAPVNGLSIFKLEPNSEATATGDAVPQSVEVTVPVIMRHPIAAIGLTIILAFVASIGIFTFAARSQAGKLFLDWGGEMWGGSDSQSLPQSAAQPASRAQDSSKTVR